MGILIIDLFKIQIKEKYKIKIKKNKNWKKVFLNFFIERNHTLVKSSSLIPDDKTLLFTNSGMIQFKDIFTGNSEIPKIPRASSSQICIRAGGKHNDLDNVGYTSRHHTFFEMLGNFSFGDYFKDKAIEYSWEFIQDYLELNINKIWVTVHNKDIDSYNIWKKFISKDKIIKLDDKDNFWSMGDTGACGYCSEIFYDQGEQFNSKEDYIGGNGDRYLEIWNLVFMEFERNIKGELKKLPKPSIDTGMGYERIVAIKEGVNNNYHSSLFMPLIHKLEDILGLKYNNQASFRVISDHLRSCAFLLSEGINFDKDGKGYVLRRIMRRAIRFGYLLGKKEAFIYKLVDTLIDLMGKDYPQLIKNQEIIKNSIKDEEKRFLKTIESGISLFNIEIKKSKNNFSGEVAFKLYDTFGFPLDLTQDMLRNKNIKLDANEFNKYMQIQKNKSKNNFKIIQDIDLRDIKLVKEKFGINKFIGYENINSKSKVLAIFNEKFKKINSLNGISWIFLDKTPFYAESGGQVGDIGKAKDKGEILDTQKFLGINLSKFKGKIKVGEELDLIVDKSREEISKHHSATHLLNLALNKIIGENIVQKGSLVEKDRLRFDFSSSRALTEKEIKEIEDYINNIINKAILSKTQNMKLEEAKKVGAIGLFPNKYKDEVRVVNIAGESTELCGGTHIKNSSDIEIFIILKESKVSSGVRRIKAICGKSAKKYLLNLREELFSVKEDIKIKDKEISKLKKDNNKNTLNENRKKLKEEIINKTHIIIDNLENGDIKKIIDDYKNKYEKVAIMLFQAKKNKLSIACGTKGINIKSGEWIKKVTASFGGKGGGRDDFAQGGIEDISKLEEIKKMAEILLLK